MYQVISLFADLKDNKHVYHEGDKYPRDGILVDNARIEELMGDKNSAKRPLIKKVEDDADRDLPVPEKLVRQKTRRKRSS